MGITRSILVEKGSSNSTERIPWTSVKSDQRIKRKESGLSYNIQCGCVHCVMPLTIIHSGGRIR